MEYHRKVSEPDVTAQRLYETISPSRVDASAWLIVDVGPKMTAPKPRSILPDAVNGEAVFLIKACSVLHLTYEIRLATFMAQQSKRRLEIVMTTDYRVSPALDVFASKHGLTIRRHTS